MEEEGGGGTARVQPAANGAAAAEWNGVLTVEIGGRRSAAEGLSRGITGHTTGHRCSRVTGAGESPTRNHLPPISCRAKCIESRLTSLANGSEPAWNTFRLSVSAKCIESRLTSLANRPEPWHVWGWGWG